MYSAIALHRICTSNSRCDTTDVRCSAPLALCAVILYILLAL